MREIDMSASTLTEYEIWEEVAREVRLSLKMREVRALKIIHGNEKTTQGKVTKKAVAEWLKNHEDQFKAVIPGERYNLYDPDTALMRHLCGNHRDRHLGDDRSDITVLWLR